MGDPGRRYTNRERNNQPLGRTQSGARVKPGVIAPRGDNGTMSGGINRRTSGRNGGRGPRMGQMNRTVP
jgi:hypothetical protein